VPDLLGAAGLVMLGAGAVTGLVALVAVVPAMLRVRRRAQALQATVASSEAEVRIALALLEARRAERTELLEPWVQLARWARHPLVVATVEWYLRRRRRRS
jgi:hypothetical protein